MFGFFVLLDHPNVYFIHLAVGFVAKLFHPPVPPLPCLTVGTMFLGLKVSPRFLQTYYLSLWPNVSLFVSSDRKHFSRRRLVCPFCFNVSFGTGASFVVGTLSVQGDVTGTLVFLHWCTSSSWQLEPGLFLNVLTTFFSSETDRRVFVDPTSNKSLLCCRRETTSCSQSWSQTISG